MIAEFGTITVMSVLVSGRAHEWYQNHIRNHEKEWALRDIALSIMNELFPPNITELLREKFERANQGSHGLKEWHQYFEKLASRVAHITDTEKRRRFWYGSAHYQTSILAQPSKVAQRVGNPAMVRAQRATNEMVVIKARQKCSRADLEP